MSTVEQRANDLFGAYVIALPSASRDTSEAGVAEFAALKGGVVALGLALGKSQQEIDEAIDMAIDLAKIIGEEVSE